MTYMDLQALRINKLLAKVYTARDKPIRRERRIER